jgi:site-specific recombinase XerD
LETGNDLVAEPLQYSSDFGHSFKMKISEISLYFNGLRFHLSILPKNNYLPLCCYTGLSYIDLCNLTKEDIKLAFDGKLWIMIKREKTGVDSNVPLLEIPKQILAKYEGKMKGGKLLPVISNQKMNEYLGEIAEVCQIDKRITFHLARHTFATEICLTQGVPIESVSKMLGHTNIQTTQIYARVVDRKLSHDMAVLEQKLQSKGKRPIAIVNP